MTLEIYAASHHSLTSHPDKEGTHDDSNDADDAAHDDVINVLSSTLIQASNDPFRKVTLRQEEQINVDRHVVKVPKYKKHIIKEVHESVATSPLIMGLVIQTVALRITPTHTVIHRATVMNQPIRMHHFRVDQSACTPCPPVG